ncbi:MAG: FAD-binding oxidoreductase [Gordonia sp. (in: high G+C Gram-positive bacteria)]|uniref:FAD-binding oxidoreductase n=1 Tax=Gordonia sp. (in: high G+C Gram-positive bacteria) TaxID=84139 RepID=UPI0039E630F0
MQLLDDLAGVVGDAHVLTDPSVIAGHLTDWTGRDSGPALAVVRPASVAETARVVRLVAGAGAVLQTQGGNTGLVGGSVPPARSDRPVVVLSTVRLDRIDDVDVAGRTVGVGAGVTLAALHEAAARAGLAFGVDLAARDSATIGGMVATNAGGIHVVRYGDMRAQVLGIEAVLASGEILRRWLPLRKDNVGYDLPALLAGSEGTLAVITGVLVRLVRPPARAAVAVAAVDSVDAALRVVTAVEDAGLTLQAAELMTRAGIDLVVEHGARRPVASESPFAVLVEGAGAAPDALAEVLAAPGLVDDAAIEAAPAGDLWTLRESHTETIARSTTRPIVKLDVSAPTGRIGELLDRVAALAAAVGGRSIPFGHLADGNIHVNVLDVPEPDAAALTREILTTVAELDGSVSAEHGVGRAKTDYTRLGRSEADMAVMRRIKDALDPDGVLNPGVIFPM